MRQEQFLTVVSVEQARQRWAQALGPRAPRVEAVPLERALDRVLARDVTAPGDVPAFDRSNLDGFAVRAADTFGAEDERPRRLSVLGPTLAPGDRPPAEVTAGTAQPLGTGAMLPRGADAVVPLEHTDPVEPAEGPQRAVWIRRPVVPGAAISPAGSDVARGETLLRAGERLTSRETGTLAACGIAEVAVLAPPRVGILSTGGELVAPGSPARPGQVHDANGRILADAVREQGGEPVPLGIAPDERGALHTVLSQALTQCDLVLVSGGTSKGGGDLVPEVVATLGPPGLLVHGVDLKPGKPLGLAVCSGVPVALLPGFPTSAVFTFHEVVAPLLRTLAGLREPERGRVRARLPRRLNAERGRTEYLLVNLVEVEGPGAGASTAGAARYVAHPMGKGSGSVTAFARADGFVRIPGQVEHLAEGEEVEVVLLGREVRPADLVVVGSACVGLDVVLGALAREGLRGKTIAVGSTGGLEAARRGECDLAPVHLLDPATGTYNTACVPPGVALVAGYRRRQALCFRPGDPRFAGRSPQAAVAAALADPGCRLQNRNRGSGTRVLVDRLLAGAEPPGVLSESRNHHAVAAAVAQGRADWGVCLETVARAAGLATLFVADEHYDFLLPVARAGRPAVRAFVAALDRPEVREGLARLGFARP